ncbi:MAG: hypothetical protein K0R15_493 [Clostridiales bacterium]|jgi:probable rRNA maturation factor|nr:hypothetical protein [Clostridiales bacterium]
MTINIEKEIDMEFDIDYETVIKEVVQASLKKENFKFDIELNVILTNNEEIRLINNEYRNIDKATDVLSFPQIEYNTPADFAPIENNLPSYINPDTQEVILGDIIISMEKVIEQANEYGHTIKRELSFLVAHSMLHLFGYDHMEPEEDKVMQEHQEAILNE